MTILGNGNVGIGTSTPSALLQVNSARGSTDALRLYESTQATSARIFFTTPLGSGPDLNITSDRIFLNGLIVATNIGANGGAANFTLGSGNNSVTVGNAGTITLQSSSANTILFRGGVSQDTVIRPYSSSYNIQLAPSGGNLGIGTASPTNLLSLGGDSARTIWMERSATAAATGNSLTLQAGGTKSGNTDQNGGDLVLSSGTATGTGSSNITFKTAAAGATGTTDRAPATAMTILGNGYVGIGITNPSVTFQVNGNIIASLSANPAGNTMCYATSTNVLGYCSSDVRMKKDIVPISAKMLDAVMQLRPVTFKWIDKDNKTYAGFIAQEVEKTIPLAARKNPDGHYGLDSMAIEAYLVGAIQEMKAANDNLRSEFEAYKATHP
jgi:Chaperone of endosialidase